MNQAQKYVWDISDNEISWDKTNALDCTLKNNVELVLSVGHIIPSLVSDLFVVVLLLEE